MTLYGRPPQMPSTRRLLAVLMACAVLAALAQLWMQWTFALVRHPVALGTANLQPDAAVVRAWYRTLIGQGTYLQMIRTEVVDLVWAVCLAMTLVALHRFVGGALRQIHPRIAALLFRLAPAAAIGPAFDVIENAWSLAMLTDPWGFPDGWARAHATASWCKIGFIVASSVLGIALTIGALVLGARRTRARA